MIITGCLIYIGYLLGITNWFYWTGIAVVGLCQIVRLGNAIYKLGKKHSL